MSDALDGFLNDALDFLKDAAPYIAIAAITYASGGTAAAAESSVLARLTAASGTSRAAGYAANVLESLNESKLARSSWTIYKRILGQNLLRATFDKRYDVSDAARDSFSTSSWITESILLTNTSKAAFQPLTNAAKARLGLVGESSFLNGVKNRLAGGTASHVSMLLEMEKARKLYPTLNFVTGEIESRKTYASLLNDISRKAQLTALSPTTPAEQFFNGIVKGGVNQFAGTFVFRNLVGRPHISRAAWATNYVQNLDELYLPTTQADAPFQKAFLALRSFDVLTAQQDRYGSYRRLNRRVLYNNIKSTQGHAYRLRKLATNTITPNKIGRLTGNLAMRQMLIATGEDERMGIAYAKANSQKKHTHAGTVNVSGYYRDGHWVKPHTRSERG